MKHVVHILAPILAKIFNQCIVAAAFPERMQVARVTVLYKKGERNNLANYRPVSILPVFSKVFEKILHSRLSNFIDKCNLLTPYQFGFRKNKSTEIALLEQKEYILTQFESKAIVVGIFVDYSKAFDLVNHNTLLKKLACYGVRGQVLLLLKSYLSHRKQVVQINNTCSKVQPVLCGVPQGSILGPLLFNIYLNDIVNINPIAKFIIYADDASIFFSGNDIHQLVDKCNFTMKALEKWSVSNSMQINEVKTKAVIFRQKNKPVPVHKDIILNSRSIEIVEHFKCLGVVFSSTMSWDSHINHIVTKIAQITGIIGRAKYLLSTKIKLLLYNSLFCSHLNYCQLVWGTTTFSNLQRVHILQKKCLRHIYNEPYGAPSTNLFYRSHVIQAFNLYRYRLSSRYKLETRNNITNLRDLAHLQLKNITSYSTRHRENWVVRTPRSNYGKDCLSFILPSLLNRYHLVHFDLFTCKYSELRRMYETERV